MSYKIYNIEKKSSFNKILYTFWTKPWIAANKNEAESSIKIKKFYLLSFLHLRNIFNGEIELVTDEYGKFILDGIKYDKITLFDESVNDINENLWSYPKIYSINLYDEPILHIDGDLILTNYDYAKNIFNSSFDVICQSIEYGTHYNNFYNKNLQRFIDVVGLSLDYDFLNYFNIVYNTGILGFKNVNFKKYFCKSYFNLLNKIKENDLKKFENIKNIYQNHAYMSNLWIDTNCYIEQSLLSALSMMNNLYVKCFIPVNKTNHFSDHAIFFHEDTGLKHWAGSEKWKNESIINYLDEQLFLLQSKQS